MGLLLPFKSLGLFSLGLHSLKPTYSMVLKQLSLYMIIDMWDFSTSHLISNGASSTISDMQ